MPTDSNRKWIPPHDAQGRTPETVEQDKLREVVKATLYPRFAGRGPVRLVDGPPRRVRKADQPGSLIAIYSSLGALLGMLPAEKLVSSPTATGTGQSPAFDANRVAIGFCMLADVLTVGTATSTAPPAEPDAAGAEPVPVAPLAVAKAKRPEMTWERAVQILEKTRAVTESLRVTKQYDTRYLKPLMDVEKCFQQLDPLVKAGPPAPRRQPDAEQYLRRLGEAAIAMQVRKSGQKIDADPMLVAATTYAAMPPAFQAEVRKALAETSMASRARARRALSAATAAVVSPGTRALAQLATPPATSVRKVIRQGEGPLCATCLKAGRHVHMVDDEMLITARPRPQ
jgi:hypothetical protein